MQDLNNYSHDLKRNLSSLLAGATLLLNNSKSFSQDEKHILIEMSAQCEETIKLFEEIFVFLKTEKKEGEL